MKRLVAVLLLSLQLAHVSSALLAGVAHRAFHLTEQLRVEMQRAQQQRMALILASHSREHLEGPDREPHRHPAPERTPHVHGAHDEDAHTHTPAVDLLIGMAGPAEADAVGPTSSTQQSVDNHLPAAEAPAPVAFVVTASHPADVTARPSPILSPSPPPPRI